MRQLNPIASSSRSSIALAAAGALGLFLSTATARADIAPPQIIRIGKPTPAPQKVPVATPNTNAPRAEPNMWQLAGGGMEVSFASTGIDGKARLTVTTKELGARSFTGDQIRITPSEIGTLVTVTIAAIPDLSTTTLTLILPGASVEEIMARVSFPLQDFDYFPGNVAFMVDTNPGKVLPEPGMMNQPVKIPVGVAAAVGPETWGICRSMAAYASSSRLSVIATPMMRVITGMNSRCASSSASSPHVASGRSASRSIQASSLP